MLKNAPKARRIAKKSPKSAPNCQKILNPERSRGVSFLYTPESQVTSHESQARIDEPSYPFRIKRD